MQKLCPTCGGKGSIDDPKAPPVIIYCGPNGERCPQIPCQSCGSLGWVSDDSTEKPILLPFVVYEEMKCSCSINS